MAGYAEGLQKNIERGAAARRMRGFYEPAFFGQEMSTYDHPLGFYTKDVPADLPPPTMGGFEYLRDLEQPPPLPGVPQAPPHILEQIKRDQRIRQTHASYGAPPVGPTNLAGYGVNQLQNYGVGALQAYRPLASLRRR